MNSPIFFFPDFEKSIADPFDHQDAEQPEYARFRIVSKTECATNTSRTVEGMARHALQTLIVEADAGQSICLAGVGTGGLIALEAAILLLGRDRAVGPLALIDVSPRHALYTPKLFDSLEVLLVQTHDVSADLQAAHLAEWCRLFPSRQPEVLTCENLMVALGEIGRRAASGAGASGQPPFERLKTIQTGSQRTANVFCIPGAGGNIAQLIELAQALGPDLNIHGLQPRGLDGHVAPHSSVEAAAIAYRQAMEVVPACPEIHLIGHSYGGWVAFEIANVLESEGRPVTSLTLVDTEAPGTGEYEAKEYSSLETLEEFLDSIEMSSNGRVRFDRLLIQFADAEARLGLIHSEMVSASMLPRRTTPDLLVGPLHTFSAARNTSYRPNRTTRLAAGLVCVSDPKRSKSENEAAHAKMREGWKCFVPNLQVWEGPGNHMTILSRPHAERLAAWWKDRRVGLL